jgi:hypothetical protein
MLEQLARHTCASLDFCLQLQLSILQRAILENLVSNTLLLIADYVCYQVLKRKKKSPVLSNSNTGCARAKLLWYPLVQPLLQRVLQLGWRVINDLLAAGQQ